jgi:hypothetical protein
MEKSNPVQGTLNFLNLNPVRVSDYTLDEPKRVVWSEQITEIVELLQEGYSVLAVSKLYSVHVTTMYTVIRSFGYNSKGQKNG